MHVDCFSYFDHIYFQNHPRVQNHLGEMLVSVDDFAAHSVLWYMVSPHSLTGVHIRNGVVMLYLLIWVGP